MAGDAKAIIRFDNDHKLDVIETPAELEDAINAATAEQSIPLIRVTRKDGSTSLVNAQTIRVISEPKQFKSASFQ
jgi:hypothetical protein